VLPHAVTLAVLATQPPEDNGPHVALYAFIIFAIVVAGALFIAKAYIDNDKK
jgi:hypothetical protein